MRIIYWLIALGLFGTLSGYVQAGGSFELEVVATTTTQIVLQWSNAPANAASFELQRATDPAFTKDLTTYPLTKDTRVFSDTNRPVVSKDRFMGKPGGALLKRKTTYHYRVKAVLDDGGGLFSNAVRARVSAPVRGVEGDLWADVVLGKPDFGQNVIGRPTKHAAFFPGGVAIDKTVRPNRMYIADCNNNRILGIAYLGVVELGISARGNLARKRPYRKSEAAVGEWIDTGDAEFTDGVLSTTMANSFAYRIPGGGTRTVDIDVDLGSTKRFNFVVYSTGRGWVNYRAGSLAVLVSKDADHWVEVARKDNPDREAEVKVGFKTVQARYVRFRGTSQQYGEGAIDWFFIGEGMVGYLDKATIAERGKPCSTDSDCRAGNQCRLTPERGADIVLGQPGFDNLSGGNGDSCAQLFPYRVPASARTLCLTLPTQISMGETVVKLNMAVDGEGSLYVPDIFNNRILKYKDPFGTDRVADGVWGQADFAGNEPNRGQPNPSRNSLNFHDSHCGGVGFDAAGNMWVADTGNHRVLRFPKVGGVIQADADIVLGQESFTTRTSAGFKRTLAQTTYPRDVEFDESGRLYVSDGDYTSYDGRVIVFEPPFASGKSAARRIPIPRETDRWFGPGTVVNALVRDVVPGRMWMQKSSFTTELIDLKTGRSLTGVNDPQVCSADIDSDGNLFTVAKWSGVYRYPASSWPLPWAERAACCRLAFPQGNATTADTTGGIVGVATFGKQLLVSDRARVLIWNDFDAAKISSGRPPDDVYGQDDFTTMTRREAYVSLEVDSANRLWTCRKTGALQTLQAFEYPLTRQSRPVKEVELSGREPGILPVRGGGTTQVVHAGMIDFAIVGSGDKVWIADRNMSRVLRINNVDGLEDPSSGPYVDIVLGQNSLTGSERDLGDRGTVVAQGLAEPYNVSVSANGDLFIADNGGEVGSNRRIVRYARERFPDNPSKVLFSKDIGDPDGVIGTEGRFDLNGLYSADPMCSPFELGFHPRGPMVVPMNGYSAQRFPLVYLDPVNHTLPDLALGDYTSYPVTCFVDAQGNVYIGDFDWFRVLIYRKPFSKMGF